MKAKNIFVLGFFFELLLFLCILFLVTTSCDDGVSYKSFFIGKYTHEGNDGEFKTIMTIDVKTDETYMITGSLNDEITTWIVITEMGIWEQNKNKLILNPNECRKLNFESGMMETCDCFGKSTYVVTDSTITDGDIVLKRM